MQELIGHRLEIEDLIDRVAWINDPAINANMTFETPLSLARTHSWFASSIQNIHRRDFAFWIPNDGTSPQRVAMGGLTEIELQHRHAELYLFVAPHLTGRGIGQQALRWLCNFGFVAIGLERIYLYTLGHNDGARRLYERNGFVAEGVLRNHIFHQGKLRDRYVHGLLRSEWQKLSWSVEQRIL